MSPFIIGATKSISRVLYLAVIYLGCALPQQLSATSKRLAEQAYVSYHGFAPNRVYMAVRSP